MSLDPQIAAVLQSLEGLAPPDFSQLDATRYRQFADNLMAMPPGAAMHEVRELRVAGDAGELDARLYRPLDQERLPLLVFFHGGGFIMGTLDTHDYLCRALASQTGAVVVSVAYRLAPEAAFPAAPLDCYAATCWLVEHAAELGIDGSRLALAGDSAGGNLALAVSRLASQRQGPKIRHQCLFYPVLDAACDSPSYRDFAEGYMLTAAMMRWFWSLYGAGASLVDEPLASPLRAQDLGDLPPTTLITAGFDPLRDEGEAFARRLQASAVPVRLQRCEGMIHGFISLSPFVERAAQVLAQATAELRKALG